MHAHAQCIANYSNKPTEKKQQLFRVRLKTFQERNEIDGNRNDVRKKSRKMCLKNA